MKGCHLSPEPVIDYYFAPMSGYAYLGHARLLALVSQTGTSIRYHPLDMARVFAAAGSFPPAKYPDIRQKHRKADMARWAAAFDLPFNETPAFWPAPMQLACEVIMAADAADQGQVTGAILSAVWVQNLNISVPKDVATALVSAGLDPEPLFQSAETDVVKERAEVETQKAIEKGVFGSPTYVLGDDWFFGQDRLDFLAEALPKL